MDWIMHTVGAVSHLWAFLGVVGLFAMLGDPYVKAGLTKVNINGQFFVPWIGIIAYWMWVFVG